MLKPFSSSADRLTLFFAAARPLLGNRPEPNIRRVNTASLQGVLSSLRPFLERKRSAGGFFNVWSAAGLRRDEVRNAGVLATLLNPAKLGNASRCFFGEILREASRSVDFSWINTSQDYSVSTEICPLGNRETRVDLIIEGKDFLLGVEVKIDAAERLDQLEDYSRIISIKAANSRKRGGLIYLSPRAPRLCPVGVAHITWQSVSRAAKIATLNSNAGAEANWLLEQFRSHIAVFKGTNVKRS